MRILHVTNIISHHQLPLARKLADIVGADNFRFATTHPPDDERKRLGWTSGVDAPWIIRAGERKKDRIWFEQWWEEADVIICGERRFKRMHDRLQKGKLTFYMSERWWKPPIGMTRLLHPRFAMMTKKFRHLADSLFFHLLPIGAYAASDIKKIASFTGNGWQWGYFTELPNPLPSCERAGNGLRVLWAGRMLAWKRVDILIRGFSQLQHERPDATLTLVGDGPERTRLEQLAKKLLAVGSYRFSPPVPVPQVLELMQQQHIYVLPSNGYEGWGAVVNEAMSVGCTVVASVATGSAKTMIRHGENGLLFKPGDWQGLGELLCSAGKDEAWRIQLAREGQRTITECWSPAIAAERFLSASEALLAKRPVPVFNAGPMAPAWE